MASDLYLRTSSRSSRGMAEPAAQRWRVIGGGGPGDVTVRPDQHGADTGEFAGLSGQLRGHGVQAVRETGGGGRGGSQVEQEEPRGGQEAEQRGGATPAHASTAQVEVGRPLAG